MSGFFPHLLEAATTDHAVTLLGSIKVHSAAERSTSGQIGSAVLRATHTAAGLKALAKYIPGVDMLRREVENILRTLRSELGRLNEVCEEGPTPRWVDADGTTAAQLWASWALTTVRSAEQDLHALALPLRHTRLTDAERAEVEQCKHRVAELRALFTTAGGHLLPGDLPSL